jgi:hypothetical protein
MDITSLDNATGRLVVELRLKEITEVLANIELDEDSTASYRAVRLTLQDQLAIIYDDVCSLISHPLQDCFIRWE